MGKGDIKTRRGKIVNGSSGKRRHKKDKSSIVQPKKVVAKVKTEAKPKVETKEPKLSKPKASAKKPAAPKEKKETKE